MYRKILALISTAAVLAISQAADAGEGENGAAHPPVVAVMSVGRDDIAREISFDSELRPFQEVELHARVSGYLETLKVDAGDMVKEGQLLASLDVPELKLEVAHAQATERRTRAEIDRAKAAYEEAHMAYTRLVNTDKAQPRLIAAQDIDAASARNRSAEAALEAAKEQANVASADVQRLSTMLDYSKMTAPFSGVITKRYLDCGALIQAGTSSGSLPLLRLSQQDKLRLVIPVSLSLAPNIKVGNTVKIHISTIDRALVGTVSRFSRKVDSATRTMDTEVDVPNADLSLIPGMYATATLELQQHPKAIVVPHEAIARGKSGAATLYIVTKDNRIEERPVTLGLETALKMEVLSGVSENELVLVGSRSLVTPGQIVQPKMLTVAAAKSSPARTAVVH